jgi:hypothetical protein
LQKAREAIRVVERLAYGLVSEAEEKEDVEAAQLIMRLAVGLRRKLDTWRS